MAEFACHCAHHLHETPRGHLVLAFGGGHGFVVADKPTVTWFVTDGGGIEG